MLKIKNYQLVDALEFLEKAELKPKASRVRTKLSRLLFAKVQDLQGDEMALLEKFGKRDDSGRLIESGGTYSLVEDTAAEYHTEKRMLLEETAAVNVDELHEHIGVLMDELINSDMKLAGKDAESFALLLDALEAEVKP
jgi:uncharacterized small protein (DUF1192 family)